MVNNNVENSYQEMRKLIFNVAISILMTMDYTQVYVICKYPYLSQNIDKEYSDMLAYGMRQAAYVHEILRNYTHWIPLLSYPSVIRIRN